jgi:chromosome segregation ATPase
VTQIREDSAEEYRDLKRELEQTAKNCRILQFQLKKVERQKEQADIDKIELERSLSALQAQMDSGGKSSRLSPALAEK